MKAVICAEWIGQDSDVLLQRLGSPPLRKPWCAEVELQRKGFSRKFLRGKIDYSMSNSKGSRGVMVWFTVESGRVYEIKRFNTWKSSTRIFLRVDSLGNIKEGNKEDAAKWLSDPSG